MVRMCAARGSHARACVYFAPTDVRPRWSGLQSIIVSCIQSLYGDVGLPGEVDVLQVLKDKTAVLRVPFDKQVRRSPFTPASKLCAAPLSKSPVQRDACGNL
jgi:hypothetical protein